MVVFGNKKVTIYNRYFNPLTEVESWFPTVLTSANLVITKGANIVKAGIVDADSAKLFLDAKSTLKPYVTPKKWLALEDKTSAFTFQPETDFFVDGNVSSETVTEDFFQCMVNKYDNVFRVSTVDEYKDVMPHMEIGGK